MDAARRGERAEVSPDVIYENFSCALQCAKHGIAEAGLRPSFYFIFCIGFVLGCENNDRERNRELPHGATENPDSVVFEESWNVGDEPDEPETSVDTRFAVRVKKFQSGVLTVVLDSASSVRSGTRSFFTADSVRIAGLEPIDRFTQGCKYGSGPWRPTVGVVSDTVHERYSRPKLVWLIDTVTSRLRQLPPDSASCFVAGPE